VIIILLTIAAMALLAFANGANDVSKGIATLAGSGRATYRQALVWGTAWTAMGAAASLVITAGLVEAFTSALVSSDMLALPTFALGAAAGASAWVLFASRAGLPVSTTHAMTGAIVGVAVAAGGTAAVQWPLLAATIAAPLALSPIVSAGIAFGVHGLVARVWPSCVCVEEGVALAVDGDGTAAAVAMPVVSVGQECAPAAGRLRVMSGPAMHWGAAAALSFARGVNDNAKIAALGALAFASLGGDIVWAFLIAGLAMTAGSFIAGLRVSRTLAERVVHMDADSGLAGSLVSAGLVLAASFYVLPVSTTHVATGAIVGAGLRQGGGAVEWRTVGGLIAAWVVTLPIAAAFGAVAVWMLQLLA
jgi:PiT family inorganic phosphate transporter